MSRDVRVVVEEPERRWHAGETIRGYVEVEVEEATRCGGISVILERFTHGRGNLDISTLSRQDIFDGGTLEPGVRQYPFEVVIPSGELTTYHGHYLNIDWRIKAQVDVPWAFDPKDEVLVAVDPATTRRRVTVASEPNDASAMSRGFMLFLGVPFLLVTACIGFVIMALSLQEDSILGAVFGLVFGLGSLSAAGQVGYSSVQLWFVRRKLGEVQTTLESGEDEQGAFIDVSLRFIPSSETKLNTAKATLMGREVVVSGSGTNRSTSRHTLHDQEVELAGERILSADEAAIIAGRIRVPDGAPCSIDLKDNDVKWSLDIHLDIADWPDHLTGYDVEVVPAAAADEPAQRAPAPSGPAW